METTNNCSHFVLSCEQLYNIHHEDSQSEFLQLAHSSSSTSSNAKNVELHLFTFLHNNRYEQVQLLWNWVGGNWLENEFNNILYLYNCNIYIIQNNINHDSEILILL